MKKEPAALGAILSIAVKAILMACSSFDLPITEVQAASVALAVSTVVDACIMLGLIRGRVVSVETHEEQVAEMYARIEVAREELPEGAVSAEEHAEAVAEALETPAPTPVDPQDALAPYSAEKYA